MKVIKKIYIYGAKIRPTPTMAKEKSFHTKDKQGDYRHNTATPWLDSTHNTAKVYSYFIHPIRTLD